MVGSYAFIFFVCINFDGEGVVVVERGDFIIRDYNGEIIYILNSSIKFFSFC